jgi:hypothetical protein
VGGWLEEKSGGLDVAKAHDKSIGRDGEFAAIECADSQGAVSGSPVVEEDLDDIGMQAE